MKPNRKKKGAKTSNPGSNRTPSRFNARELAFQPWFLPRASRLAINALIPPGYRNKMRAYFDDYGCMRCGNDGLYDANGMCLPCHHLIRRRLKTCVRRRMTGRADDRLDLIMQRRKDFASKLLGRFSKPWSTMSLIHRVDGIRLRNPVDEALGFLTPGGWRGRYQQPRSDSPEGPGILGKSVRDLRPGKPNR